MLLIIEINVIKLTYRFVSSLLLDDDSLIRNFPIKRWLWKSSQWMFILYMRHDVCECWCQCTLGCTWPLCGGQAVVCLPALYNAWFLVFLVFLCQWFLVSLNWGVGRGRCVRHCLIHVIIQDSVYIKWSFTPASEWVFIMVGIMTALKITKRGYEYYIVYHCIWLMDWLVGWLIDWLVGWLIDWLIYWSDRQGVFYKTNWLVHMRLLVFLQCELLVQFSYQYKVWVGAGSLFFTCTI